MFQFPAHWPEPADPAAVARLVERFSEQGTPEARLTTRPDVAAMLAAIGGNSPYLADLAVRESASVRRLVRLGPDAVVRTQMAALRHIPAGGDRAALAAVLRRAKRRVALATALADIGGIWHLGQVTAALSALAEAALQASVAHLLRTAHAQRQLRLPHPRTPAQDSGFTVLGMGKLGARELNYSSDVDLVLIYDPGRHAYHGNGVGGVFTRLARDMVALMETRDADGYVFRCDLRLRPDPAATPPAIALPAALTYYESMGENWERAAMIKARPVAGDLALGERFLAEIRPFVWRRHLDFPAIADIRAMKRRMDDHHATALPDGPDPMRRIAGHDVKLGEGGIRGVEFTAQTLQLVWGGRDPRLRAPATKDALGRLVEAGRLEADTAGRLCGAYDVLRQVEHRLQMVADRQTHRLPMTSGELARFALFMGYADPGLFASDLLGHLEAVRAIDRQLFRAPDPEAGAYETLESLAALGFASPERVVTALQAWRAGRPRALRSERARRLLDAVLPRLLKALAIQREPDAAFNRFDTWLSLLPAGVPTLSLLQRNPALLNRIAAVLGAAPALADHLAQVPAALEGLLTPDATPPPGRLLAAQLGDARALEDAVALVRRMVRAEEFRLAVGEMEGQIDADAAGVARTALADTAIAALLPRVLDDYAGRFGRVPGGAMVLVALGKAGGREMMAGSDLDLMLVYDHPQHVTESDGPRPLAPSQYYARAAHAVVAALTAPGAGGPLYDVDMRLRPSGNKGPVAVSLAAFRRYHAADAWTWERMALTRARVVAGFPALQGATAAAIVAALMLPADPASVRADAADMRARLLRDLPGAGPWDVKLRPGGQIEVEFIAQTLQLVQADPVLFSPTTRVALARLHKAGALDAADAALLTGTDRLWRTVQGLLRITLGRRVPRDLPVPALETLLAVLGCDEAALHATLARTAMEVRAAFERHVGKVAT